MNTPLQAILGAGRLTTIIKALQDIRDQPHALRLNARIKDVPATDGEVLARYVIRAHIADLIADDQRARTYQAGKFQFSSNVIPNLKVGYNMTQEDLNTLAAIQAAGSIENDPDGVFRNWQMARLDDLRLGVEQRKEHLKVSMVLDDFNYDQLGIKLTDASWGMPSDLKVTLTSGATWDNPTTATPVTDVLTLKRVGEVRYGEKWDRITLSTAAFIYVLATTEFQNRSKFYLPAGLAAAALPFQDTATMKTIAMNVWNVKEVELYDDRYWTYGTDGQPTSAPFWPITAVGLSSTADDNNPMVMDFGNCPVTEAQVSAMLPTNVIGNFGAQTRGPIAYATPTSPDLNPPGINLWAVARGWPRKKRLQATAVLNVGSFSDPIAVTEPF